MRMNNYFKLYFIVLVAILVMIQGSFGQERALELSPKASISVITFGPFQEELWSAFGHNGIRVYDPQSNIDWMYDWGRFDFEQTNFFWNFARGHMLYSMGRTKEYQRHEAYYINSNRRVQEQVLNLTHQEVQLFFNYLEQNNLPENREYLYNYVYDNCATRIRDAVQQIIPTAQLDLSFAVADKSVRDLMDDYLSEQPWGDLIIDVALAHPIDEEAKPETYMFLPDYVYMALKDATVQREGISMPLVKRSIQIHEPVSGSVPTGIFTPFNMFVLVFFIVGFITNKDFKNQKRSHWIDVTLFSIVGFFGWWFVFLWFATSHLSMYNWNLLWAVPFYIPLVFLLNRSQWRAILSRFYRFIGILNILLLLFWTLIPQPLHMALIPLVLTIIFRSFYISYDLGKLTVKLQKK